MTTFSRRSFIEASAAASALAALGGVAGLRQAVAATAQGGEQWVKSVCRYCGTGCGLFIGVREGKVFAVRGDKDNHNDGFLCLKGFLLPQILTAPDRCLHPLVRKEGKLVRASWEEAMGAGGSAFSGEHRKVRPRQRGFLRFGARAHRGDVLRQ
jgi:periplasmic nitrate reductase subunit NapA apoprotein